jgi:hypothetical protein
MTWSTGITQFISTTSRFPNKISVLLKVRYLPMTNLERLMRVGYTQKAAEIMLLEISNRGTLSDTRITNEVIDLCSSVLALSGGKPVNITELDLRIR